MVKHQELQQGEPSIASDQRRQQFGYDGLGNWLTLKSDDGDGSEWDLEQSRTNNAANEITGITETANDPVWVDPAYDKASSMISGPKPGAVEAEHCYQYDAWNRLRRVFTDGDSDDTFDTGETVHQENRYDGLNRRIVRIAGSGSSWLRTDLYYNASWQILEEKVSATQTTFAAAAAASTTAKYQYVWDLRYIDSPVLRDEDLDSDGDCTDDEGTGSERLCYANDANFNVTALIETDGSLAERTIYDAYGQPTLYDSTWATTIAESASKANEIRFCGYVYDAIVGLYHVRYRVYHPTLGRWVQRDPAGYVDGSSLYQYCVSNPWHADILGLGHLDDDEKEQVLKHVILALGKHDNDTGIWRNRPEDDSFPTWAGGWVISQAEGEYVQKTLNKIGWDAMTVPIDVATGMWKKGLREPRKIMFSALGFD